MRLTLISSVLFLGLAACGGSSKGHAVHAGPGGDDPGQRLPWEATLTQGARFELHEDLEGNGETVVATVAAVELDGAARVYRLDWGEGGAGPSVIRVEGTTVTINDAKASDMQAPYDQEKGDGTCYGEDFSNPDGCEDVCDASICISPTDGIVSVFGLYAPNAASYSAH